jgi:hypothetical protein
MRRALLLAVASAAVLAATAGASVPISSGAPAPSGQVVFVSPRATANPGEIWALAPGSADPAWRP